MDATASLPFFRRSHGAFTGAHEERISQSLSDGSRGVFDPFLGRGRALFNLASESRQIYGIELLPPVYLLGYLDRPDVILEADALYGAASEILRSLRVLDTKSEPGVFLESWMTPAQDEMFGAIAEAINLRSLPQDWSPAGPDPKLVVAAAYVCSARLYVAWRRTKNAVWFKRGGVPEERSPAAAAQAFLDVWFERASHTSRRAPDVRTLCTDATSPALRQLPRDVSVVVTSPPYANGHNYARQWAPEAAVSEALGLETPTESLIGVSTRSVRPTPAQLGTLPDRARRQLELIGEADIKDSATYYFRRFSSYAIGLQAALANMDRMLTAPSCEAMFVVRDTSHGDVLFESGRFIVDTLTGLGWIEEDHDRSVIRAHIGNKRRARATTVGRAQVEHVLHLRRG